MINLKRFAAGLMLLALCSLGAMSASGQVVVSVGNQDSSAANNGFPFFTSAHRFQTCYAASDLNMSAGDQITSITIVGGNYTPGTFIGFQLDLGYTTATINALGATFDLNYVAASQTTVIGPASVQPAKTQVGSTHLYTFTLTTPFVYDGTSTLLVDWRYTSRTGNGFTVATTAPSGGPTRMRVYNSSSATAPTGSLGASSGNLGIRFTYAPAGATVQIINNSAPGGNLPAPNSVTDLVLMDLEANAYVSGQTLTDITVTKTGTITDAQISAVSIVRDDNLNGTVEGTDTVLDTDVFTGGTVDFSFSQAVAVGANRTLLIAVTYNIPHAAGTSIELRIVSATDVTWSGGNDVTPFPMGSGIWDDDRRMTNATSSGGVLPAPTVTDLVVLDITGTTINASQTLSAMTVQKSGTIADGDISNVKLVLDNNNNGSIEGTDTVLDQGTLSSGSITFAFSQLVTASSVRLLVGISYTVTHAIGSSITFQVANTGATTWTGGSDLTTYPLSSGAWVVPLTGTFTVANGNPGGAFDYADIGAFFDDLESAGMNGPVTLEVYDDGGSFTSTTSYQLGGNFGTRVAINGLGAANPLVIRAASGESPVITGAGAPSGFTTTARSPLSFYTTPYTTIEGLELVGGVQGGIIHYASGATVTQFHVRRCKIHGVTAGGAFFVWGNGTAPTNGSFTNNMVWDCHGDGGSSFANYNKGVVAFAQIGSGWVISHNTILHTNGLAGSSVFRQHINSTALSRFDFNVVHLDHASSPVQMWAMSGTPPATTDGNVIYLGTNGVMSTVSSLDTWAKWQAAGHDPNGVNADPQLANISTGTEDLHLTGTSPALELAVASTEAVDIDGNSRPIFTNRDSGADEFEYPEIDVQRNSTSIPVSTTDSIASPVSTAGQSFTWTILNTGASPLGVTNPITVTPGTGNPTVTVTTQPATSVAGPTGTTTFIILVEPIAAGAFDFDVSITNTDPDEGTYDFTVDGTGVLANQPAVADVAATSTFTGSQNGPFSLTLAPGANLVTADLTLSDTDADTITVNSITLLTGAPTGITAPGIPTPGQPITFGWTGVADASNTPGTFTWEVEFQDAVNGTPVTITVNITIQDLAPTHTPATGQPGAADGSVANPYVATFIEDDTTAANVDLADLADANTGQTLVFSSATQTSGPSTGAGFNFALTAGGAVLSVNPAGTLVTGDVGVQVFDVIFTDGTTPVTVTASITVDPQTPPVFTPNGTGVSISQGGSMNNVDVGTVSDVQDAASALSVVALTVPSGITVSAIVINPTTGVVTCTISAATGTTAGASSITFEVTDTSARTGSGAYNFTVLANNVPTITPVTTAISVSIGGSVTGVTIATVTDVEDASGTLTVTATSVPVELTITNIVNTGGTITADISVVAGTLPGLLSITLQVQDSNSATATGPISIDAVTPPSGGGGGGGGGGGCASGSTTTPWLLLVALCGIFGAVILRRTRRA